MSGCLLVVVIVIVIVIVFVILLLMANGLNSHPHSYFHPSPCCLLVQPARQGFGMRLNISCGPLCQSDRGVIKGIKGIEGGLVCH